MSTNGRDGYVTTPVGDVLISVTAHGLAAISYLTHRSLGESAEDLARRGIIPGDDKGTIMRVIDQLTRYFDRNLTAFDVAFDLTGASDFTRRVLDATRAIPYGEVRTYGEVAAMIGTPGATQAVGNALGMNPIPIVIPCHRVVRSDGSMGSYTGGVNIKRVLLDIEGVYFPEQQRLDLG